ncbi:MAG: DUF2238 domain-containing protein [Acholeplasmataceae bacterium]
MTKKEKVILYLIILINLVMIIGSGYLLIQVYITNNDPYDRLSSHFATIIISLLPILYIFIKKKDSNLFVVSLGTVYIFLAVFLGASLNFYNLYENINYDKLIHVLMGYVSALIGLGILIKTGSHNKLSPWIVILFVFSFALMISAVWELLEFSKDMITGSEVQGKRLITISGKEAIDVGETMFDILSNFIGALLFSLQYLFYRKTNKSYLMNFYFETLSK